MSEKIVMTHMLSIPDLVRRKQLSDSQINLVRYVQIQILGLTASTLSDDYGISTQSASARLKALWLKGYLSRIDVGDGTGGVVYEYWVAKVLQNINIPRRH